MAGDVSEAQTEVLVKGLGSVIRCDHRTKRVRGTMRLPMPGCTDEPCGGVVVEFSIPQKYKGINVMDLVAHWHTRFVIICRQLAAVCGHPRYL